MLIFGLFCLLLQPFSLSSTPPKWLAELEKDDMDMLQGTAKVFIANNFSDMFFWLQDIS